MHIMHFVNIFSLRYCPFDRLESAGVNIPYVDTLSVRHAVLRYRGATIDIVHSYCLLCSICGLLWGKLICNTCLTVAGSTSCAVCVFVRATGVRHESAAERLL